MAKDSILWLNQITLDQHALVGGKAATLGLLRQAGLPVPDGFCLPIEVTPHNIDTYWEAITKAYRQLAPDDGPVAVRSSGLNEDSPGASFAGQYETVLNVRGVEALRLAIEHCWQSAKSSRAQAYRSQHEYDNDEERIPLLVQQQVPADVSGVLFTADPVSGSDEEMLVEAVLGLAERLVSGHVTPAQYRVSRLGHVHALSSQTVLSPEQCHTLAELGVWIERILGSGQDIEWAIAGEHVYILQARPIPRSGRPLSLSQLWTRANIGEVLPHVITPLTWAVFQATLLNKPALVLAESSDHQRELGGVTRIHGRAYIRLDGMLDSFCYLPTITPLVMSQVLGVDLPSVAKSYVRPAGFLVRLAQAAFILDAMGFLPRLSWITKRMSPPPVAIPENLVGLVAWTTRCFQLHLKCTAYAIGAFGFLKYFLSRWMPEEVETLLPQILTGSEDLQTAAQGISLWRLAEQVRKNPSLRQALEANLSWPASVQELSHVDGGSEFLEAFQVFLEANGARAAGEFELATPRWREAPSFVLEVLLKFVQAQQTDTLTRALQNQHHRRAGIAQTLAASKPVRRWVLIRLMASYRAYTVARENMKYRLMEGYAALRRVFLEIDADLVSKGALSDANDVFFLTPAEALALVTGEGDALQKRDLIQTRKAHHAGYESQIAPDLVVGGGQEFTGFQEDGLTGIGCSPGIVDGVARVLFDIPEMDTLRPGEILVAPHTDPGWTPLFLICKAVVTEVGGFLSHGATVAREYGVPAVVNVKGATRQIHTGDFIRVDGGSGRVTILNPFNER